MFAWAEFHLSRMTLSSRSGVGEATVRNASDARRRHRRCRRATPTQNPSDSWVGASLPHSEPRRLGLGPLPRCTHTKSGHRAVQMREVQICATGSAPYSLKIYASPLAESMSFSIVIQLEAKRAAPSSLVGRLCASAAALAAAATMRRASVAASKGWYIRRSEATAPAVGRSAAMAAGV